LREEHPMKLSPDKLVVASFDTTAPADPDAQEVFATSICPTPATQCFVCPAPSSPEDGCL
jgi:hypothetical protein